MPQGIRTTSLKITMVVLSMAAVLVPAWVLPAQAVQVPSTMARRFDHPGRVVKAGFVPSHVAFSWEGREGSGISFLTGEGWTRAPEAHDLEEGPRHHSGVIAVGGLAAVRWRPFGGATRVSVDLINTTDGPLETRSIPATAEASASTPDIVTRAEWGADESLKSTSGGCDRDFFPLQQIFVHHTAGLNDDPDPEATMRAIYWYHTRSRGYCDIAYNFVIGPDGRVYEGRWARNYAPWETHSSENLAGKVVMGAHTAGHNAGSVGIAFMGNYVSTRPDKVMKDALVSLLAWEADRHGLDPEGTHRYVSPSGRTTRLPVVAGHRDAGETACPGGKLYRRLPRLRERATEEATPSRAVLDLDLTLDEKIIEPGTVVEGVARLSDGSGLPVAGREIVVQEKKGKTWSELTRAYSGLDGEIRFSLAPTRKVKLRALYEGNGFEWEIQSRDRRILVAHVISLEPTEPEAGDSEAVFRGSAEPVHGKTVYVHLWRKKRSGFEKVAKQGATPGASGDFAVALPAPAPGTYKAIARYPKDGRHLGGRSGRIWFTVPAGSD